MSPIPWAAILTHGPALVSAAEKLFLNQSKVDKRHQSYEARLDQLKKTSTESARLIQELAQQVQALTEAQAESARRVRTAFVISSVAAILAVLAVILAAVR